LSKKEPCQVQAFLQSVPPGYRRAADNTPTGGKLWNLKYRIDGKEKKISFGAYPDISLAEARQRRDQARALLANGIDPSDTKNAQNTFTTDEQQRCACRSTPHGLCQG